MLRALFSKITKGLRENSFFGNILALMGASVLSQVISIAASFATARLYTPTEMGIYSNYTSILSVIAVVACLQYTEAIILPDGDRDARNVLGLCASMAAAVGVLCALVFLPFHGRIAAFMHAPELGPWLRLMPVSVLLSAALAILQIWNSRRKTLSNTALSNTVQTAASSGSQILMGLEPVHLGGGMILGNFIGRLISAALLLWKTLRQEKEPLFAGVDRRGMGAMAVRHRKFLAYIPGALCDNLGSALPNLTLTWFFGSAETGHYSLGYRLLALPLAIVGGSVGQAFMPEARDAARNGSLRPLCLRVMELLLRFACVPFFLLALVAPAMISFVFGAKWYVAGTYIKWMSPWLLFQFVYSAMTPIFTVLERQKTYTVFNILTLCVRFASLTAGGLLGDPVLSVAFCCISGMLVSMFKCAYILLLVRVRPVEILGCYARQIFHALLYAVPTLISLIVSGQNMISASVAILSGCVFLLLELRPILRSLRTIGKDEG